MSVDIVFLNGASSAGKTTIARRLQQELDGIWLHVSLDMVFRLLPEKFLGDPDWGDKLGWDRFLSGFHAAVGQLPRTGYPVILDHVCTSRRWQDECVKLLADYKVLHVGVFCPPGELRRREAARGDRKIGIAEEHLESYVAEAGPFDVEVDTHRCSLDDCVEQILAAVQGPPSPTAFERMRAAHSEG